MAAPHILVIGATGQTGLKFCTAALEAGHTLTLYARNPAKLPSPISSNENVTVITGTLEDEAALRRAAACGATIFVSFAGPVSRSKGTPITDAMKLIFPLLAAHNFQRALILGTCSFISPQDKGALKWTATVALIKVIGGSAFDEFRGLGEFVTQQDLKEVKWTLFRVPFLTNGDATTVRACYTGEGDDGMFLSRKSIAEWVLREMGEGSEWVGKTPVLSN